MKFFESVYGNIYPINRIECIYPFYDDDDKKYYSHAKLKGEEEAIDFADIPEDYILDGQKYKITMQDASTITQLHLEIILNNERFLSYHVISNSAMLQFLRFEKALKDANE